MFIDRCAWSQPIERILPVQMKLQKGGGGGGGGGGGAGGIRNVSGAFRQRGKSVLNGAEFQF